MDVLLSSVFAHGCYIKAANVIATSCLFSVCWIVSLKAIFIINIQYDILLKFFQNFKSFVFFTVVLSLSCQALEH